MRIYIIITSAHCCAERREAVRHTWLKRLTPDMTARFIVGDGPKIEEPDVVQLSTPDSYDGLWHKVREAFRYSLSFGQPEYDYLFKCDDDTYVAPERIESAITEIRPGRLGQYIGRPCDHNPDYFQGGAGYLLSRWLVGKIAQAPDCPDPIWGEDGWVGCHARELVQILPSFKFNADARKWPTPGNDLISTHGARTVETMFRQHARYLCASPSVPTL